jgi:hypothetical protein
MTPREKAEELVSKYFHLFYFDLDWEQSKPCALIAVDEILNSRPAITDSQVEYNEYWQQVKQEIKNL